MLSAKRKSLSKIIFALFIILPQLAYAIPVDWQGVFGADYQALSNYTLVEEPDSATKTDASFPSYLIKLLPVFVINDTASFKSEFSTGYARGGFFGDGQTYNYKNDQFGDVLYYYNTFNVTGGSDNNGDNSILFNRFWMELYSDTATYGIGRQSIGWGMGAIYNDGNKTWDRFASIRDMVIAKIKLGNFGIEPFFGKIGQGNTLTAETYAIEFGVPITYDVPESDMKMGFLWTKKNISDQNKVLETPTASTTTKLGASDLNIFDLYFKKSFGKLGMEIEAPFFSGDLGNFRGQGKSTEYSTFAALLNLEYKFSHPFKMGFDFGMVPGDNTKDDKFTTMYLHPNYHIASILFRYNQQAIADNTDYNVWDVYVVNTNFLKLYFEYTSEKWLLNFATIYAKADEAATTGGQYIDYDENTWDDTANGNQGKDLGLEFDFSFDYAWNNEVKLGGEIGYLMTGDYYEYNNKEPSEPFKTANPFLFKLKAAVTF